MKADYLEFKDKCIQMLTEIGFLNQVQMTKEEILSVLAGCRLEEPMKQFLIVRNREAAGTHLCRGNRPR